MFSFSPNYHPSTSSTPMIHSLLDFHPSIRIRFFSLQLLILGLFLRISVSYAFQVTKEKNRSQPQCISILNEGKKTTLPCCRSFIIVCSQKIHRFVLSTLTVRKSWITRWKKKRWMKFRPRVEWTDMKPELYNVQQVNSMIRAGKRYITNQRTAQCHGRV